MPLELLTSLQNPRFKRACALHSSRGRKQQQRFIVFGWREVSRCLDCEFPVEEIFICRDQVEIESEVVRLCQQRDIRLFAVSNSMHRKLAYGDRNDGIVATVSRRQTELSQMSLPENPLVVVLESAEKPGNVGAVFRTADAVGACAVILANPLTDMFHPNAIRASMATVFSVPSCAEHSTQVFEWLQVNQLKVFATRVDGASSVFDAELTGPTAIVIGNESRGLSETWNHPSVRPVQLPMQGISDSLNLSNTAAVCLYECYRQRKKSRP